MKEKELIKSIKEYEDNISKIFSDITDMKLQLESEIVLNCNLLFYNIKLDDLNNRLILRDNQFNQDLIGFSLSDDNLFIDIVKTHFHINENIDFVNIIGIIKNNSILLEKIKAFLTFNLIKRIELIEFSQNLNINKSELSQITYNKRLERFKKSLEVGFEYRCNNDKIKILYICKDDNLVVISLINNHTASIRLISLFDQYENKNIIFEKLYQRKIKLFEILEILN